LSLYLFSMWFICSNTIVPFMSFHDTSLEISKRWGHVKMFPLCFIILRAVLLDIISAIKGFWSYATFITKSFEILLRNVSPSSHVFCWLLDGPLSLLIQWRCFVRSLLYCVFFSLNSWSWYEKWKKLCNSTWRQILLTWYNRACGDDSTWDNFFFFCEFWRGIIWKNRRPSFQQFELKTFMCEI